MERPNVEHIENQATAMPDFSIYTEDNALVIKCEESDQKALKSWFSISDGHAINLIRWIEYLEGVIKNAGIDLDSP